TEFGPLDTTRGSRSSELPPSNVEYKSWLPSALTRLTKASSPPIPPASIRSKEPSVVGKSAAAWPTTIALPALSTATSVASWFPGPPRRVDHLRTPPPVAGKLNRMAKAMSQSTGLIGDRCKAQGVVRKFHE